MSGCARLLDALSDGAWHGTVVEAMAEFGISRRTAYRAASVAGVSFKRIQQNYVRGWWPSRVARMIGETSRITGDGYRVLYLPMHPACSRKGYIREHRVIAERILGRLLEAHELVHHEDEDRRNNSPANLRVLTKSQHQKLHADRRRLAGQSA